jgi:signal transduction histidine kinase
MQTQPAAPGPLEHPHGRRSPFARSASDRVLLGVAGGLGRGLGIDPMIVRLAFVALATAGGAGIILYLLAWAVSSEPDNRQEAPPEISTLQQTVAIALVVGGLMLILRAAGVWFGDPLAWPVAIAVFGSAVIWTRGDEDVRARWQEFAQRIPGMPTKLLIGRASPWRVLGGTLLIAAGMAVFLAANDALFAARNVLFAIAVTVAGGVLILGPGVLRLARQLSEERRERIRQEERANVAAHLHDSVLQTLALLQRSDSPQEMTRLARVQERELRSWLYGKSSVRGHDLLSTAVEAMANKVESLQDVAVEVVVVGDCPLDDGIQPLVLATGEAVTNSAAHSGTNEVSVYVEAEPEAITVFIRDQGKGFELDAVPDDRLGIADSIIGRMQRVGGTAKVTTAPGEGTEWQLTLPRRTQ